VSPSRWFEGLPMTIIEAFSRGRPVLACDLGEVPMMVDDSNGWLTEPSPVSLARALDAITPGEAARRAEGARRSYLERYTPAERLAALVDVYRAVATRR
jgi:glycosyltransferase involved in cell wall biosynthesis